MTHPTDAALDQGHELHQRIALAQGACSDAVDLLLDSKALAPMTARSLRRVLAQAMRHLADAERLTQGSTVAQALLLPESLEHVAPAALEVR